MKNIITKDTVVAKLEGYAQGCYSNSEAYGEIFIPIEIYEQNKELVDGADIIVYELDGKHSETHGQAQVIINTLENFLINTEIKRNYSDEYEVDLTEQLYYEIEDIDEEDMSAVYKLNTEIISLAEGINEEKETELILSEDTKINDIEFPKGTIVKFNKPTKIKEGVLFII